MADALEREPERVAEALRPGLVALQQVIGHALRRLRPDAGQAAQRGDELIESRRVLLKTAA